MSEKIRKNSVVSSFLVVLAAFGILKGTPGDGSAGIMTFVVIGIKIIPMIAAIRMVNKMPLPQRGMWLS